MTSTAAPAYKVPPRKVVAVEHPMVIKNLDNGLKTFGTNRPFERIVDTRDPDECVPLYIRHNDPLSVPILSFNAPTNNVLLKITVPKRIGRKRKRADLDPFLYAEQGFSPLPNTGDDAAPADSIRSQSRKDHPTELLRTLKDNVGNYSIEPIAEITNTHRFRGLPDFHHSTTNTDFFPRFRDTVLTGRVDKIRQFQMDPSRGVKPNDQFMPPPRMSTHTMPFNWGWHQNPKIYTDIDPETGNAILVNRSAPLSTKIKYLPHDVPNVPDSCPEPLPKDPGIRSLIALMQEAFEERPIWTRRAMINRISHSPHLHHVRHAFQFVSYQFRNGAWREAAIKLGFDPRKDPKCRIYQTVFFKTSGDEERHTGTRSETWQEKRSRDGRMDLSRRERTEKELTSHIFDGKSVMAEGKVWQVCDITDPLLVRLIQEAPYPSTCDSKVDGWFPNGSWAKIKAVMRTKLIAIRIGKEVSDQDFAISLAQPDFVPGKTSRGITVPVPELGLTAEEMESLKKAGLASSSFQLKKAKRLARQLGLGRVGQDVRAPRMYNGRNTGPVTDATPETPDSRAQEAADQLSNMGMFDQAGTPGSGSGVLRSVEEDGSMDDEGSEDQDDDEDDLEQESEEEDESDGDRTEL